MTPSVAVIKLWPRKDIPVSLHRYKTEGGPDLKEQEELCFLCLVAFIYRTGWENCKVTLPYYFFFFSKSEKMNWKLNGGMCQSCKKGCFFSPEKSLQHSVNYTFWETWNCGHPKVSIPAYPYLCIYQLCWLTYIFIRIWNNYLGFFIRQWSEWCVTQNWLVSALPCGT